MRGESIPAAEGVLDPLEISTIADELKRLGSSSHVFSKSAVAACNQAAYLLERLRVIGLSKAFSDGQKVELINEILAQHGDG